MQGPEGFTSKPVPEEESGDEAVMSRRSFLKRGGAALAGAALGVVGAGYSEDAEARRPSLYEGLEELRPKIEFKGFRPNPHQKVLIETRLRQITPRPISTEMRVMKSGETAIMQLSIISGKGKETRIETKPFTHDREGNYITSAIGEVFDALEGKLKQSEKTAPKESAPGIEA